MEDFLLALNQPIILWSLFTASVVLILIDYFFPVDWPAYIGYVAFSFFIGATISLPPIGSLICIPGVFILLLVLHEMLFSRYLTNAPRFEQPKKDRADAKPGTATPSSDAENANNV
jgi:vacuolar-type H+-ATPase subunit I/STV1